MLKQAVEDEGINKDMFNQYGITMRGYLSFSGSYSLLSPFYPPLWWSAGVDVPHGVVTWSGKRLRIQHAAVTLALRELGVCVNMEGITTWFLGKSSPTFLALF